MRPDVLADIGDVTFDWERRCLGYGGQSCVISPAQADILLALWQAYPESVTTQALVAALYGTRVKPASPAETVKQQIRRLRNQLDDQGFPISIVGEHSAGYRVSQVTAAAARHRVLLVEDNSDDVELMLNAFRADRIEIIVEVARTGMSALARLLRAECDGIDMVILDMSLPDMSGVDVLRALRSQSAVTFCPVIVLSNSDDEVIVSAALSSGAHSYFRKPSTFSEFRTLVRDIWRYWLANQSRMSPRGR